MQIREEDKRLIDLILSDNPTQADLDSLLYRWDLEVEGADKGLLLALFKQKHSELMFTRYVGPRLDGLIRYFRFKDVKFLVELNRFHGEMASRGIPFVVLGDMALRLMEPDTPRSVQLIEVGVPKKYVKKAKDHASEMIGVVSLDESYLSHTHTCLVGPQKIHILRREEMIYRLLLGLEYGLNMLDNFYSLPQIVLEIHEIISFEGVLDWSVTRDMVSKEKTGSQIHNAIEYYSSLTKDVLEDFSAGTFSQKEYLAYENRSKYFRDVMKPCRAIRRQYNLSKLISDPACLFQWLAVRIRFKYVKLIYSLKWR